MTITAIGEPRTMWCAIYLDGAMLDTLSATPEGARVCLTRWPSDMRAATKVRPMRVRIEALPEDEERPLVEEAEAREKARRDEHAAELAARTPTLTEIAAVPAHQARTTLDRIERERLAAEANRFGWLPHDLESFARTRDGGYLLHFMHRCDECDDSGELSSAKTGRTVECPGCDGMGGSMETVVTDFELNEVDRIGDAWVHELDAEGCRAA